MYLYIDESGTFTRPLSRKSSVSCVGALVIPEVAHARVMTEFAEFCGTLGVSQDKIKGRSLNEPEIAALVHLLAPYDVLLEVAAIDMQMQTADGVAEHKLKQAANLTKNLDSKFSEQFTKSVLAVRERLERLPNQLYTQACVTWELISNVLQKATLYYAQRKPAELAAFHWYVDAKEKKRISEYDDLWSQLVRPMLQSKSGREPFMQLNDPAADYSAFERFCGEYSRTPEHLLPQVGEAAPFEYIDINFILQEHFEISTAEQVAGLAMADILVNAVRRAMNGNLQFSGWASLGSLIVQGDKTTHAIPILDLSLYGPRRLSKRPVYQDVLPYIDRTAKSILTESVRTRGSSNE